MLFNCGVRLSVFGYRCSVSANRSPFTAHRKPLTAAFTFIEILIALVVIAVLFIPMIQLFSNAIYAVTVSGEGITAVNLARWEMERVKNLNLTKSGLKKIGDLWTPSLDEPALEINQAKWRILRRVSAEGESAPGGDSNSGPLMVRVEVYRDDNLKKPMVSVSTLIEDSIWI